MKYAWPVLCLSVAICGCVTPRARTSPECYTGLNAALVEMHAHLSSHSVVEFLMRHNAPLVLKADGQPSDFALDLAPSELDSMFDEEFKKAVLDRIRSAQDAPRAYNEDSTKAVLFVGSAMIHMIKLDGRWYIVN